MIVFANNITPRLRYICYVFGLELYGAPFLLTNNKIEFRDYQGPRINYSNEKVVEDEILVIPHPLLSENNIKQQDIECFKTDSYKAFFKSGGDFPFDIFAASFYLLSRYEEYLPHSKDMYGRFAHENSLAYKEAFLNIPLINVWLQDLRLLLQNQFPAFQISNSQFTFLPTYDIDEAYSFRYKQWWRSAGAAVKDLLTGKFSRFRQRRRVLDNKEPDPYDSFAWIYDLHRPYQLKPHSFFLVASKTKKYDKNILPGERAMQTLIRQHAEKYSIGVHPSWQSGDDPSLIRQEIETLEQMTKVKITSSRQHFIRFTLPDTFRHLIKAGIKEDFSMGYGSINGFRASIASPFYWYDLEKEEQTHLLIFPFCYMEANSFFEQKQTPQQALEEMLYYHNTVKSVNGTLITIWHNTFLGTDEMYKGWREIYKTFLEEAVR